VTSFLGDLRIDPRWTYPAGTVQRGDEVGKVSPGDEHFWPTLSQTASGAAYLVAGKTHSSILRLDGFESIRRLDLGPVPVTPEMIGEEDAVAVDSLEGQQRRSLTAHIRATAPVVDGDLSDWSNASWVEVDDQLGIQAAVAVSDDSLYIALRAPVPDLLANASDGPAYLFTNGGGIDVWVGRAGAEPERTEPVAGDRRVVIARKSEDPPSQELRAALYEQVRPEASEEDGVTYTSPIGSTRIDYLADVSGHLTVGEADGQYEVAIPLALLGLSPAPGQTIQGDVGVLIGDGTQTIRRVYWNNSSRTTVADVPSEARFFPVTWGTWEFAVGGDATAEPPSAVPTSPGEAPATVPDAFDLGQNHPNPFNPLTTIGYRLPKEAEVSFDVYNALGQRVARLCHERRAAGVHQVVFDGSGLPSGVYFYRVQADAASDVKWMSLAK
jgi:hypothetical protein